MDEEKVRKALGVERLYTVHVKIPTYGEQETLLQVKALDKEAAKERAKDLAASAAIVDDANNRVTIKHDYELELDLNDWDTEVV